MKKYVSVPNSMISMHTNMYVSSLRGRACDFSDRTMRSQKDKIFRRRCFVGKGWGLEGNPLSKN